MAEENQELTVNEYQRNACRTLIDKPDFKLTQEQKDLITPIIELCTVTSHFAEKLKKGVFHQKGLDVASMRNEIDLVVVWNMSGTDSNDYDDKDIMLIWNVLGLLGETGEIANLLLSSTLNTGGLPDKEKMKAELGDVAWYLATVAEVCGISLEEVMEHNTAKLKARYPDGYSHERSGNKDGIASL